MPKRSTIKDIATAAKVSIATVSYIVNKKNLDRISPETIKRVNQWINLFNYYPSETARSLQNSRTNNIAFISAKKLSYFQKIELMNFLELFSLYAKKKGYKVFYIYQEQAEEIRNCDAIVAFNLSKTDFYALGNQNAIPIIAVDIMINDVLFYQITKDYQKINALAKQHFKEEYTLITIDPQNEAVKQEINKAFKKVVFIDQIEEITTMINYQPINLVVFDSSLKNILETLCPLASLFYYSLKNEETFNSILECIGWAIERIKGKEHDIKI